MTMLLNTSWGQMVLIGITVCLLGIIICGRAGMMKEKELSNKTEVANNNSEYKFGLGIFLDIISGVLSACFAFGIDAGKDMANEANNTWKAIHPNEGEFLYQNNVPYVR